MSVPKQRHSNQRQARGRIRYVKKVKTLRSCPKCSERILSHRVCPKCGNYKDREYSSIVEEAKLPTTKEKAKVASKKK